VLSGLEMAKRVFDIDGVKLGDGKWRDQSLLVELEASLETTVFFSR